MNQNQKEQGKTAQELTQLISSIQLSPLATLVTDCRLPDNPIIAINEAFAELTGYAADEVLGRNCRFLSGPATEPENIYSITLLRPPMDAIRSPELIHQSA